MITHLTILVDEPAAFGGRGFGTVGTYRRLIARAHGEVDPDEEALADHTPITDLERAPRNDHGRVEYASDVQILAPTDPAGDSGVLVHDIPNRGNPTVLGVLNRDVPEGNLPGDAGDGFAMERGHAILVHGWQGDVLPAALPAGDRLCLRVPVARHPDGSPITGPVRAEYVVGEPVPSLTLSAGAFVESGTHAVYRPADPDQPAHPADPATRPRAVLTRRRYESDERTPVPGGDWAFADCSERPWPGRASPDHLAVRGGFETDAIYELVYTARDPLVLGLGLLATRDLVEFCRHEGDPARNPLAGRITHAVAFGSSQSGRFLRSMLDGGFGLDSRGRPVWDGVHVHVATGRATVNVRFGQPGRGYGQHEDHLFPQGESPVTWAPSPGLDGARHGLLDRSEARGFAPKIVQTVSSSEYRQARMSLTTTDLGGTTDRPIPDHVRVYLLAGTQHGPAAEPELGSGEQPTNAAQRSGLVRALLVSLVGWVVEGVLPPPSRFPTVREDGLASPDAASIGWPPIPGVTYTARVNEPLLIDFGAGFDLRSVSGVISVEPPHARRVPAARVLVPRVDGDGNEIAGVRPPALRAPTATHTGWNVRREGFCAGELAGLSGMQIPFAVTRDERQAAGDPRPSLQERYGDHEGYVEAVSRACAELVKEGFLLPEDATRLADEARRSGVLRGNGPTGRPSGKPT